MIRSLATIVSLIPLTSCVFDGSLGRATLGEGTGDRYNPLRLVGYGMQKEPVLDRLTPDLDQSHVTRVFDSNEDGPYFWENGLFQGNTHVRWKAIDAKRKELSRLHISQKVWGAQFECEKMRKQLQSHQELKLVIDRDTDTNAYSALDNLLKKMPDYVLESDKKHHDLHMKIEDILVKYHAEYDDSVNNRFHAFITQVFGILNVLFTHDLLKEEVLEKLAQNEQIRNILSTYIVNMFSKESFLGLEIHECILKSQSTEKLAIIFKFFQEEFFKNVEYQLLEDRILLATKYRFEKRLDFEKTAIEFWKNGFQNDDGLNMKKKEEILTKLVLSFDTSSFDMSSYGKTGSYVNHQFGIIYDMICFSMRYHLELFKHSLGDKKATHAFSIKMNIADSAIRWLQSARETSFIGLEGFWTSQHSFLPSQHHMPLKKVKYWKPEEHDELDYFKNNFRCYNSRDLYDWMKVFGHFSLKRSKSSEIFPVCVNKNYNVERSLQLFGINVGGITEVSDNSKTHEELLKDETSISKAFLADLDSWVQRMQLLSERNRENKEIWSNISEGFLSGMETDVIEDIKDWFGNSGFISTVLGEIQKNLSTAISEWERFKAKLELANQSFMKSMQKSQQMMASNTLENSDLISHKEIDMDPPFKIVDPKSPSSSSDINLYQGFTIPNIQF